MGAAAHWGYQDWEVPEYDACEECGKTIRVDRLDLMLEHECVCTGETDEERLAAELRLIFETERRRVA